MANPDYGPLVAAAARRYGIPTDLFNRLVKTESGFDPTAKSPVGAVGFTQLMPATAASLGVDPLDPQQNLEGGARYLRQQFDRFKRWDLALAAYNAGPGAVEKAGGVPQYPETQRYVRNILSGTKQTAAPQAPFPMSALTGSAPDISGTVLQNVGVADPIQQLANLTSAVANQDGLAGIVGNSGPLQPVPTGKLPIKFEGASLDGTDPRFAHQVGAAALAVGATAIRLASAHRTPESNTGVSNSNHLYGHAFDGEALIDGKWVPLGVALKPVVGQFGLRSGDVPGFYKGGRDAPHVDDGFNQRKH